MWVCGVGLGGLCQPAQQAEELCFWFVRLEKKNYNTKEEGEKMWGGGVCGDGGVGGYPQSLIPSDALTLCSFLWLPAFNKYHDRTFLQSCLKLPGVMNFFVLVAFNPNRDKIVLIRMLLNQQKPWWKGCFLWVINDNDKRKGETYLGRGWEEEKVGGE